MLHLFLLLSGCAVETLQVVHEAGYQAESTEEQSPTSTPDESDDTTETQNSASDTADVTIPADETSTETSTDDSICAGRVTGTEVGDCAINFTLDDRNQEPVSLYDYAGQVIFIDSSSFT